MSAQKTKQTPPEAPTKRLNVLRTWEPEWEKVLLNWYLRCPVRLQRNEDIIPLSRVSAETQNNTNTNTAWDTLLVKNSLSFTWNSNFTGNPAFLFAKAGSLTHFPNLTLAPHFWWLPLFWSEIPVRAVCDKGKGWNVIVSPAGNTGRASQKALSWRLETSANRSPWETHYGWPASCPQPPPYFCWEWLLLLSFF